MASTDAGDSCCDDDFSDCSDDETSLGGWLVGDDVVEYMDALDNYLDDDDDEPVQRKKRRLVRAEPETDDEDAPKPAYRNKKWVVDDEEEAVAVVAY